MGEGGSGLNDLILYQDKESVELLNSFTLLKLKKCLLKFYLRQFFNIFFIENDNIGLQYLLVIRTHKRLYAHLGMNLKKKKNIKN